MSFEENELGPGNLAWPPAIVPERWDAGGDDAWVRLALPIALIVLALALATAVLDGGRPPPERLPAPAEPVAAPPPAGAYYVE